MSIERIDSELIELHQGERICYSDVTNKQTFKRIHSTTQSARSTDSMDLDSIRTGESLFKTFTFDIRQEDDPDMKKCLSFWKSILEKNVRPVKCSLLKSKSNTKVIPEEKPPVDPCDQEETQTMWLNIYKDLQRRQLDKIKMGKTPKYDILDALLDEEDDKEQEKEEIRKLNEWSPPEERAGAKKFDINAQIKRTVDTIHTIEAKKEKSRSKVFDKTLETTGSETSLKKSPIKSVSKLDKLSSPSKSQTTLKPESPISTVSLKKSPRPKSKTSKTESQVSTPSLRKSSLSKSSSKASKTKSQVTIKSQQSMAGSKTKQMDDGICDPCQLKVEDCFDETELKNICCESQAITECGVPCDCVGVCTCQPREGNEEICKCGCGVMNCQCQEIQKLCICGCIEEECVCEKINDDEAEDCTCGCGQEDCICQLLFTRACKCGSADCDCDLLEILTTYIDTIDTPKKKESATATRDTQTHETGGPVEEVFQVEATYCVICGHYNCFCNVKK